MIQRRDDLFDNIIDFPEIANPAFIFLGIALDTDSALEGMAVDFFEKVIGIGVAEVMGGFKLEIFFDLECQIGAAHGFT